MSGNALRMHWPLSANLLMAGSIGNFAKNGTFTISDKDIPPPDEKMLVHSCKFNFNFMKMNLK